MGELGISARANESDREREREAKPREIDSVQKFPNLPMENKLRRTERIINYSLGFLGGVRGNAFENYTQRESHPNKKLARTQQANEFH